MLVVLGVTGNSLERGSVVAVRALFGARADVLEPPVLGAHLVRDEDVVERRKQVISREKQENERREHLESGAKKAEAAARRSLHESKWSTDPKRSQLGV